MRVIENKKVAAKTSDKSIMHGVEEKTELSKKKDGGGILNSAKRSLGSNNASEGAQKRTAVNIPNSVQRHIKSDNVRATGSTISEHNAGSIISERATGSTISERATGSTISERATGSTISERATGSTISERATGSTISERATGSTISKRATGSTISKRATGSTNNVNVRKARDISIGKEKKEIPNALKARYKHSAVRSRKRTIYPHQIKGNAEKAVKSSNIKVLKNGTVSKAALLKIRKRGLDKKIKRSKARLHFNREDIQRLKRRKPKRVLTYGEAMREKKRIEGISKFYKTGKIVKTAAPTIAVLSDVKNTAEKTIKTVSGTARTIYKPITAAAKVIEPFSEMATSNSESAGGDSVQFAQRSASVVQTAAKTTETTAEKTAKGVGKTAHTVSKVVDPKERHKRKLKKAVKRQVKQTKREVKTAKAAAKTAKTAAKTSAKATQKTADVVTKVVKAAAQGVARIASFIVSTMPWSAIIIGIVLVVVIIIYLAMSLAGSAVGAVTGGGGWAINDTEENNESDIYDNLSGFIEQFKEVCESNIRSPLKSEITSFCAPVSDPQRIIAYTIGAHSGLNYPATGADTLINGYIDEYLAEKMTDEQYAKFLAALFVLMTREKQDAEGMNDATVYDFDFEKADFEEFFGSVDTNTCRFGSTYIIKTTEQVGGVKCPGENCKIRTISGCHCGSTSDSEGHVHYYCKGHPYCPSNHTKLTVNLKTVEDATGKTIPEIYDFTDNEKARYEATSAFIAALLTDKEAGLI